MLEPQQARARVPHASAPPSEAPLTGMCRAGARASPAKGGRRGGGDHAPAITLWQPPNKAPAPIEDHQAMSF